MTHACPLHVHTQALDRQGMALIEAQDAQGFADYETELGNTICGRHAIAVLLHMMDAADDSAEGAPPRTVEFTHYSQSERVTRKSDSSVSYAAAEVRQQG